jgi:hypothetical protein
MTHMVNVYNSCVTRLSKYVHSPHFPPVDSVVASSAPTPYACPASAQRRTRSRLTLLEPPPLLAALSLAQSQPPTVLEILELPQASALHSIHSHCHSAGRTHCKFVGKAATALHHFCGDLRLILKASFGALARIAALEPRRLAVFGVREVDRLAEAEMQHLRVRVVLDDRAHIRAHSAHRVE